jgi:hypothetical protein
MNASQNWVLQFTLFNRQAFFPRDFLISKNLTPNIVRVPLLWIFFPNVFRVPLLWIFFKKMKTLQSLNMDYLFYWGSFQSEHRLYAPLRITTIRIFKSIFFFLSQSMYIHIYLSNYQCINVCNLVSMYLSIYVSMYLYIEVSMFLSVYLSTYLHTYLYICIDLYLFTFLISIY